MITTILAPVLDGLDPSTMLISFWNYRMKETFSVYNNVYHFYEMKIYVHNSHDYNHIDYKPST
jgi:hypothetical protein